MGGGDPNNPRVAPDSVPVPTKRLDGGVQNIGSPMHLRPFLAGSVCLHSPAIGLHSLVVSILGVVFIQVHSWTRIIICPQLLNQNRGQIWSKHVSNSHGLHLDFRRKTHPKVLLQCVSSQINLGPHELGRFFAMLRNRTSLPNRATRDPSCRTALSCGSTSSAAVTARCSTGAAIRAGRWSRRRPIVALRTS